MMKKFDKHVLKLAVVVLMMCASASSASASSIQPGFDLFHTSPYSLTLGSLGLVSLSGNPIGPGNTDTIVLRKQGIDPLNLGDSGTVDIELVALSLKSTSPVNVPGLGITDLFVTVNRQIEDLTAGGGNLNGVCDITETCRLATDLFPESLSTTAASTGSMTIQNTIGTGGTFLTTNYFVTAELFAGNPLTGLLLGTHTVDLSSQLGNSWAFIPSSGYPTSPSFPAGDFFVVTIDHTGPHPVDTSVVPLPAADWLLCSGLLGLFGMRKKLDVTA